MSVLLPRSGGSPAILRLLFRVPMLGVVAAGGVAWGEFTGSALLGIALMVGGLLVILGAVLLRKYGL